MKLINKKKATIISALLIATILIVMANIKGPSESQNLLSYVIVHSKSWPCKISEQSYRESSKNVYDTECVEKKCSEAYPPTATDSLLNIKNIETDLCEMANDNGDYDELLKDCLINIQKENIPIYAESSGWLKRDYYLGIPVTREFCPDRYAPK